MTDRQKAFAIQAAQRAVDRVPLYRPTYPLGRFIFAAEVTELMEGFDTPVTRRQRAERRLREAFRSHGLLS